MVALHDRCFAVLLHISLLELCLGMLPRHGRSSLMRRAAEFTMGSSDAQQQRDDEEKIASEFEQNLLQMFGLRRRPQPSRDAHVPRIMQHLYRAHMAADYVRQPDLAEQWETGFDLPGREVTSRVNTVRSFHHNDDIEFYPGLGDDEVRLHFDVSNLPDHETVGHAELLVHRQASRSPPDDDDDDHSHRIELYEIVRVRSRRRRSRDDGREERRLLESRVVDARNSTWERFRVDADVLSGWRRDGANRGLVVRATASTARAQGDDAHVRLRRAAAGDLSDREWRDRRPILLAYLHDGKDTTLEPRKTQSRKTSRRARRSSGGRKRDVNAARKKRKRRRRFCHRQDLYVDFGDVGWDDWIVAPHGYHAYYCSGPCPFPLSEHLNATNHAIVQTLMNSVDEGSTPKPCCVPTELSPISMLYLDEEDQVVLKTYQQMVADACGCR